MHESQCYETTLDLGILGDRTARVWYDYVPAQRGRYSGPPEDCFPDEDAEVDVTRLEVAINEENTQWLDLLWDMLDADSQSDLRVSIIEQEIANAKEAAEDHEVSQYELRLMEAADYTDTWP